MDKQCPNCKMYIDEAAKICPHCKTKLGLSWPVKIIIALVILWAIGHFTNSAVVQDVKTPPTPPESSIEVHGMNETVAVGYTSYSVRRAGWAEKLTDNEYINDKANASFLVIEITVKNDDNKARTIPPFKLIDENDAEYDESNKSWQAENNIGILEELNPGVSKTGVIVFDVPKEHTYKLKLSGGYWSKDYAFVRIGH